MSVKKYLLSVLVPAFNEEDTIDIVLQELLQLQSRDFEIEIIVVDDGSIDGTSYKILPFLDSNNNIRFIKHLKNSGKGKALSTAADNAKGDIYIIQDADLEYPVEHILDIVNPILDGVADVVYGSRFLGKYENMSYSHFIGNKVLSLVTSLLYHVNLTDVMTGHKAIKKEAFLSICLLEKGFDVEVEMTSKLLKKGYKIIEVPISYSYRMFGKAKINYLDGLKSLFKLFYYKL